MTESSGDKPRDLAEQWKGRGDDCGRLARAVLARSSCPPAWVPVTTKPTKRGEHLVFSSTGMLTILAWNGTRWLECLETRNPSTEADYWERFITHWQPLPDAPRPESEARDPVKCPKCGYDELASYPTGSTVSASAPTTQDVLDVLGSCYLSSNSGENLSDHDKAVNSGILRCIQAVRSIKVSTLSSTAPAIDDEEEHWVIVFDDGGVWGGLYDSLRHAENELKKEHLVGGTGKAVRVRLFPVSARREHSDANKG